MRATIRSAIAALALLAGPAEAADVAGTWATPGNGGRVEISRCGDALCGRLMTSKQIAADPSVKDAKNKDASLRDRPLRGLLLLQGFRGGPDKWSGGKVYNPEDGGIYSGTITREGDDQLKLKGCIVAPLCKTQTWTRVK
jgi:uncharacterized protein (DUF2147 family)